MAALRIHWSHYDVELVYEVSASLHAGRCAGVDRLRGGGGSGKNKAPEQPVAQPSQPSQPNQPAPQQPTPEPQPAPVAKNTAEGAYFGHLGGATPNNTFNLVVLENGEFWGLYGNSSRNNFYISAFIKGQGTSNNGRFTSSKAGDFGFTPPLPVTVQASYVAKESIQAEVSTVAGKVRLIGAAAIPSVYNYDKPAKLEAIQGKWSTISLEYERGSLTIQPSGTFSGEGAGCTYNGTIVPRPSGKNIYNVKLKFGSNCAMPGEQAEGIGILSKEGLVVAGTAANGLVGTVVLGTR